MIRIDPTKILVGGNKKAAENFLGPARSQLEILKNQMSFQNLSQGIRRIWLNEDVYIECRKIFNYQECRVWVRPVAEEVEEQTVRYFLVVFSTGSGNEAVVWDLVSDTVFMDKSTLAEITAKFEEEGLFEDLGMPSWIEAEYPEESTSVWEIDHPTDAYDSPIIQPTYLDYYDGSAYGYWGQSSFPEPADFTYYQGVRDTISWSFDYVALSPLPYPNKGTIAFDGDNDEDPEKASYISTFEGIVSGGSLVDEFELLTETAWPGTEEDPYVARYIRFWHPFFSYSMKDAQGNYGLLSALGYGIKVYDTWEHDVWEEGGVRVRESRPLYTGGIATREDEDSTVESLIFEYVGVCHEVDPSNFAITDMCDPDIYPYDEYFRLYEYGRAKLSPMQKIILDGTNSYRANELVFNSILTDAAQRHAKDLASMLVSEGAFEGHTGSDGSSPDERIADAGYFLWADQDTWGYSIGENCAAVATYQDNPAATALILWENSPPHYANLIEEGYSELGIGIALASNGVYVFVQKFGKIDNRYPGFSPVNTDNLKDYIDNHEDHQFIFDPVHEDNRLPKMYLFGSVELENDEFYRLTGRKQE